MAKIKIIATPPGFAPEHIRNKWVGLEIPLPTTKQFAEDPPSGVSVGSENVGGYLVLTSDALKALDDAKQLEAHRFWRANGFAKYLRFHKDVCEEIS